MRFDTKILFVLIFSALIVFSYKSYPIFSDENIYINMAKAVSEGLSPYRDFFYAHPPFHLLILSSLFRIFGPSYMVVKIYQTTIAILIILITYLISKKILKENFYVSLLFLCLNPLFLLFGNVSIGFWESLLFLLTSFYFILEEKDMHAGLIFPLSIFSRYFSLFLFLPLIFLSKKKLKFLLLTTIFSSILFFPFLSQNFIKDTILYHFQRVSSVLTTDLQYWLFGMFNIFILLPAVYLSRKEKIFFIFLFALAYEIALAFLLKQLIYHYFILSLGFVALSANYLWKHGEFFKFFIAFIIIVNILANYPSIEYYFNKNNFQEMDTISNFLKENASRDDEILGEPIIANYVSFKTNLKVKSNVFDLDLKRMSFDPSEILRAFQEKPEFIIDRKNYFESLDTVRKFLDNYEKILSTKDFMVYRLKA
jgi:hypothetical protein